MSYLPLGQLDTEQQSIGHLPAISRTTDALLLAAHKPPPKSRSDYCKPRLGTQAFATFSTTRVNDFSARLCCHPGAKAMVAFSF